MTEIQATAYVRPEGEHLAERAPPKSSEGLIGWIQSNLLATWTDRIVTAIVAVLFVWFAWSAFDSWFLSANFGGKTQAEGQMAEVISDVDDKIHEAEQLAKNWERLAEQLVRAEDRNLASIVRRIGVTDLEALAVQTRLGQTKRVVPAKLDEMIDIAQSKLPLSVYARLQAVRRQIEDPATSSVVGLEGLRLTAEEKQALIENSKPWTVLDEEARALYQQSARAIDTAFKKTVRTDAGKGFAPLAEVAAESDAIVSGVEGQQLMERPTRLALQFAALVDGVVGTPMTNIPQSRILKLRKDSLVPAEIEEIQMAAAMAIVAETDPDATGLRARRALENARNTLTDASLFLQRDMPGGHPEAIENKGLLAALEEMDFWSIAETLAEPTGEALASAANESLTNAQKAPLVWQALNANLEGAQPGPDNYGASTFAMVDAYQNQDLAGMEQAWENFEPLKTWAAGKDGSNWAVINKNWQRLLWGTYPQDKLWRVGAVAIGFLIALLPILVPACRNTPFYVILVSYPLFLLFMLGGLSVRLFGFDWAPEGAGFFANLYSDMGKVIQAGVALVLAIVSVVMRRGSLGKTAGPALMTGTVLATLYLVIMIWGTVINPKAAQQNVLVDLDFTGMLSEENQPADMLTVASVQAEIDRLTAEAEAGTLSEEEAQAKRVEAISLRPELARANTIERNFASAVKKGEGTYIVLPFVSSGQWGGLLVTMVLGVLGMAASLPIGIVLAFGRQSDLPIVRWFSTGLIEITRGVPLIALLLIVTFVLPKLLPPGADYPKLGLVFVAICLFGGVYQAEVVRGGLQSLPKGQYEAAQALGLNFWQQSRLITLPQALKAVIPAIVNTFIGLFKDTTLVIVVGIFDFLTVSEAQITAENAWNATKPETLLVISLVFFVLMFSLSRYSMWLERRLATGHR